jgi:hypothetical protein
MHHEAAFLCPFTGHGTYRCHSSVILRAIKVMNKLSKLLLEMRKRISIFVFGTTRHGLLLLPQQLICSLLRLCGSAIAARCVVHKCFVIE